jgi:hypothetical protein
MKLTLISFVSLILLFSQSFAQEVLETPLFEKVKIDGRRVYHKDNVSCYLNKTPYTNPSQPVYSFLDYTTGEIETKECLPLESENGTGYIKSISIADGFIYELINYGGTGFTTKCFVSVIKRDYETMEVIAEYDFGEFGIFNSGLTPTISMHRADDGIFLVAGQQSYGEQRNFVSKLDLDLKFLWQNDFEYFSEDGVSLGKSTVQGNNLITLLKVDVEVESARRFKLFGKEFKSGLLMLKHDTNGDNTLITPDLTEDLIVLANKFYYDEDKDEYTAFFLTIKEIKKNLNQDKQGLGYAFFRWNADGEVKQSKIDFFDLSDLLSISSLADYMDKAGHEVSGIMRDGDLKSPGINRKGFKVDFLESGDIIVQVDGYNIGQFKKGIKYADLNKSFLLFALNSDGSKKWVQFFPASTHVNGLKATQIRDDRLFIYACDYASNFPNGKYEFNSVAEFATWKNIIPTVRSVNLSDGSVDYYEPITTDVFKKLEIRSVVDINKYDDSKFGVLITHSDFKGLNWKSRLYVPK